LLLRFSQIYPSERFILILSTPYSNTVANAVY
jgi:hypothetical protein